MKIIDLKKNVKETSEEELFEWKAQERTPLGKNWQIGTLVFLILSLIFFLWHKNYFGSILILIIFLIFFLPKKEKETYFSILNGGVRRADELFPYKNLESFWIFDEANELYLKTKDSYLPYIVLPLNKESIEEIREVLSSFLPEKEAERNIFDVISRRIGI